MIRVGGNFLNVHTESRKLFLEQTAENATKAELYQHFLYYYEKYQNVEPQNYQVETFGDCIGFIKALLKRCEPEECIRLIYEIEGCKFDRSIVEDSYIYLIRTVSLLEDFFCNDQSSAHWAKKGLEMVNYFHPYATAEQKNEIIANNFYYERCLKKFREFQHLFDEDIQKQFIWDWERKYMSQ